MRGFVLRAIQKLPKLDSEQIEHLVHDLAEENERFAVVLDSMNDGVLVTDDEHRVLLINKAAERMVPLVGGRLTGDRRLWEVLGDDDIAAFAQQVLAQEESVADQEFALEVGGETRLLSCSILPLVQAGRVRGNVLHVVDISEKRGREARLRRAESLASLTTLAAGVAHEIKNPLGSIGIHAQLIEKRARSLEEDSGDKAAILENLEIIAEEIDRLNRIVVDFLFAVRPMDTQLIEEDLNTVVSDLLSFVQYELEQSDVILVQELDQTIPRLRLDQRYFKQALLNIIKNGIHAMPEGGTMRIGTQLRGDRVLLRVSDNGVGMSEEVMNKIFEPYFTTRDFGSGIGLTLVYKVVKEHSGDISVISKEGRGTTFTITLPVPPSRRELITWEPGEVSP